MAQGAITLKDGRVEQRNFDGYTPAYMGDAPPRIDVHIVPSSDAPTGMGEPPVPSISPAVMNAVARLTGKKVRKRTSDTRDELTAQERQIAGLARDGLSNPEIGAQLFISPRTVQYHLGKVFAKLEITSRGQLIRLPASRF